MNMAHGMQTSSDQKLKAIWELAGDAMVFLDEDGLLDCNDAALQLLGIDSREHAIGLPLHAFAHRQIRPTRGGSSDQPRHSLLIVCRLR